MSECKFDYEVLLSKKIPNSDPEKVGFTYSGLYRVISKEKPSAIITNAFSIATIKLWLLSYFKKISYIIWSGAINRKDSSDSFLRQFQRRLLIRRAVGFVAYGTKAKEYLVSLGAKPENIEIGINTVDTEFYRQEAGKIKLENEKIRKYENESDNKKHLLYIGHLTKRKNVQKILDIIKILSNKRKNIILDIVGDGEERKRLKKYVVDNHLTDYVMFHGFKQKADMPKYMAKADCFLFQTDFDIWGLVLVEAMSAGLPCISSIYSGATHDLVKDGVTGFAVDFSETEKVAERINWILDNPEEAMKIGKNASRFIEENASIEKSAEGFVRAITKIIG